MMWLTSKLAIPTPPPTAIARPRLFDLLDRWPGHRLVLVRAAAGYGKSSLVSMWATQRVATAAAWLSLDQSDGDPVQFVRYIAAALDQVVPGALDAVNPTLFDTQPEPQRALINLLGTAAAGSSPVLLILDDYHRVQSAAVDELMSLMLERAPGRLHLMVLSRDAPALPLARLMVTGSMLDLTSADLRFDRQEVSQFMNALGLSPPSDDLLSQIMERSEGWPAGLKMAELSLSADGDPQEFLSHLHGASQWQSEYLAAEVLAQQNPEMRQFLVETSILNRLSGSLCASVTGISLAPGLLSKAFAAGLFLIPLDDRRVWYRYHHLFQEMLQQQLAELYSAAAIRELHLRAAAWHEQQGDDDSALDHYFAVREFGPAVILLERVVRHLLAGYELHAAEVLLQRLPAKEMDRQPQLLVLDSWLHYLRTDADMVTSTERAHRAFEQMDPASPYYPVVEAELALCMAGSAVYQRRMDLLEQYIRHADELSHRLDDGRKAALQAIQFHQALHSGWWDKAEVFARQAIASSIRAGDRAGVISQQSEMGYMLLYTGRGAAAARELEAAIAAYPGPHTNYILRTLQYTYIEAAEVYYWLNNLERMRLHARKVAEIGSLLGTELSVAMAAQLLDLYNLSNPAAPDNDYAQPRIVAPGPNGMFPFSTAYEAIYQLRTGNIENALLLAQSWNISPDSDPETLAAERLVSFVAIHVAAATDLSALDTLIGRGLTFLKQKRFLHHLGRLQAVEAWRQLRLGDRRAADRMLAAAIETTARTGLVRAILDIPPLAPLLAEMNHPRAAALAALMDMPASEPVADLSSLTPTELRVLRLLADDYRYADIAAAMTISVNTVETHIRRLYGKLQVTRRMAAVEVARQAGLIE